MTGNRVRIGLVGYGTGGRYFHAPLIAAAAGCELAGVVTRSTERRAELARDIPGVAAYDSLADLAAAGVDAVVVSTPLHTHLPLVREAVGLGLPVVCDKPFAADAAAARATVELAARAGVLLSIYQNRRWDADMLTVGKVLGSGDLGAIITLESHLEQFREGGRIASSAGAAGEGPGRTNVMAVPAAATLERLAGLLGDGTLRVPVQASYPLAQVDQALKALGGQHTQGKVAITVA